MSLEVVDEEQRKRALRDLTKTFFGIEKPLLQKYTPVVNNLDELIRHLHGVFSSDSVNVELVNHLMMVYTSNYNDWKKYAKFDRYRYTRNLVDAGNDRFNLMILCWNEGQSSAIHDHADSHCFMKILKGGLSEIKFSWPREYSESALISNLEPKCADIGAYQNENDEEEQLQEIGRSTMNTNDVCYINDNIGLHRVENSSNTDVAVSLHLYCPPFDTCNVFNKAGKKTPAKVTFWSKFGKRAGTEEK